MSRDIIIIRRRRRVSIIRSRPIEMAVSARRRFGETGLVVFDFCFFHCVYTKNKTLRRVAVSCARYDLLITVYDLHFFRTALGVNKKKKKKKVLASRLYDEIIRNAHAAFYQIINVNYVSVVRTRKP